MTCLANHRRRFRAACSLCLCLLAAGCAGPADRSDPGLDLGPRDRGDGTNDGDRGPDHRLAPDGDLGPGSDLTVLSSPRFRFVVLGDTQPPISSCSAGVPARSALAPAIAARSPRFVLHVGDLMDRGRDPGAYARFAQCYKDIVDRFPLFPTMGNHDDDWGLGAGAYKKYLKYQLVTKNTAVYGAGWSADFALHFGDDPVAYSTDPNKPSHTDILPSGYSHKTYYAFSHKNSAFISLELPLPSQQNTPKTWLEKHLKKAKQNSKIDHIFVFMHHPFYVTTMPEYHPWDGLALARGPYESLLRQYDVTVVWSGHAHVYEHSVVPDDDHRTRAATPPSSYAHDGKAVHYLVTGGGSWAPDNCKPPPAERVEKSYRHTQARGCGNHFVVVDVAGKALSISVVGVTGDATTPRTSVWDRFSIR